MQAIRTEVITIGDEILYGQILDTNTHWLSEHLDASGFRVIRRTAIGDNEQDILDILAEAESRASVILITGGLGPTSDDLTKPTMAKYFNSSIELNPVALEELKALFAQRGFTLTETNQKQAELPTKCQMISNKVGTAPGMWFEKDSKVFISMPGVPFEMKEMMVNYILPQLIQRFQPPLIHHKLIKTVGIGESWLSDKIKNWEENLPDHIKLAYLPSLGMVRLRLTTTGNDLALMQKEVEDQTAKLLPIIKDYVYGFDEDTLEEVVGKLLKQQHKTVAFAESCTGGYISHRLTLVPGSSSYYNGSIIPYHNQFKQRTLGVNPLTLEKHGAVSEETVKEMAQNIKTKLDASIGIASSGIAGPDGGTPEKPVGTVWLALTDGNKTITRKLSLGKKREQNIQSTAVAAFHMLWQHLLQNG